MERLSNWIRPLIRCGIMAAMLAASPALRSGDSVFLRATQGLDLVFLREQGPSSPHVILSDGCYMGMIVDAKAFDTWTGPHFREGDTILWKGPVDISKANNLIFGDNNDIYCIDEFHGMVNEFLLELKDGKLYITAFQSLTYASAKYGLNPNVRFFGRVDQWVFFREKGDPMNRLKYFEVGKGDKIYFMDIPISNIKHVLNVSRSRKQGEIMVYVVRKSEALISQFPQYTDYISVPFPSSIENY